jgi:NADPH:quinone reductase
VTSTEHGLARSAVVESLDGPGAMVIRTAPEPPPDPGKVRVDVAAAGVCWPDMLLSYGRYQVRPELPFVPGAEVAGTVRHAPAGSGLTAGQRVAAFPLTGGFSSVVDVPPELVFELPDTLSLEQGCAIPMNYLTMHFALTTRGALRPGETVVVHGAAGGVGTAALQLVRGYGARSIAVVSTPEKAKVALDAGAHEAILADGFKERVLELTGGLGADMVVDPVGGERFTDSLRGLAPLGRLLVIGFTGGEIPTVKVNRLLLNNISVAGVGWGAYIERHPELPARQWRDLLPLMRDGTIAPPLGERYPLHDVARALTDLERRHTQGKSVLTFR